MKLRYTIPALANLDAILDYIATHSPQGARRVQARPSKVISLLPLYPYIGVRTDEPSIRRMRAAPYPYIVFYEVAVDEIVIHAIRHGARDPAGMPHPG